MTRAGRDPYAAHQALVAPARETAEFWRLLAGLAVVAATVLDGNAVLRMLLAGFAPDFWNREFAFAPAQGATPASMLVLLGSFSLAGLGAALAALLLHHRGPASLIGPARVAWRQFLRVLVVLAALSLLLLLLPPYGFGGELRPNLAPGRWLALLPLSLAGVLIQTASEEILFRGYVQQQLAARFDSRWIWMGLPALLFAAGHYQPSAAGGNALLVAAWSGLYALLAADLTARAGTLGPAIALHMANNVPALLVASFPGDLSGLALYILPYEMSDDDAVRAMLPIDFAWLVTGWLAAQLAIRR